jgi:hypothetical protein
MLNSHFVLLGFVLNMIGSLSYVVDTLKGKTRPNRVTWFMWALAPLIAFSAEISNGVGIQALQTFAVGFGPLLVLLASFVNTKAVWQLTGFDIICGGLSILGLLLWLITRHSDTAILFSILADAFAAIPTIRKSWQDPASESSLVFLLAAINAIITLLTIKHFTFANSAFAAYILAICILLFSLIRFRPARIIKQRIVKNA